jgi:rod shape-determining protein MreD
LFSWFNIYGVSPNLFIILVLIIGLFIGKKVGLALGIVLGLYIDVVNGKIFGQVALMLGIVGLLGEYLDKSFSKESRITLMLMVASTTIIYEVGIYIINIIKLNASIELALFLKILEIETIYNTIITIIMYPIIQRLGEKLESTFKPQTRGMYF